MDLPDVEMEPAEQPPSHPQQPPQEQPAAARDGWSMLSRARGLLEEVQPSLALQAVRTLAPLRILGGGDLGIGEAPGKRGPPAVEKTRGHTGSGREWSMDAPTVEEKGAPPACRGWASLAGSGSNRGRAGRGVRDWDSVRGDEVVRGVRHDGVGFCFSPFFHQ
jgi:hypothetical protein